MTRLLTCLSLVALSLACVDSLHAQTGPPTNQSGGPGQTPPPAAPPAQSNSLVGTWRGKLTLNNVTYDVTVWIRADNTYKAVSEAFQFVTAEQGTYRYSDGVLTTEPEGGLTATYRVTFVNDQTIRVVGNGISITYTRQ